MRLTITDDYIKAEFDPVDTRNWGSRPNEAWFNTSLSGHHLVLSYDSYGLFRIFLDHEDMPGVCIIGPSGDCFVDKAGGFTHHEINAFVKDMLLPHLDVSHSLYRKVEKLFMPERVGESD